MSLAQQVETYLTALWGAPTVVSNLSRIPGGASRETYRWTPRPAANRAA